MKVKKRKKFKQQLGKMIANHIKAKMPNSSESTVYTMEVFKFVNRQLVKFNEIQQIQQPILQRIEDDLGVVKNQMADNAIIVEEASP